MAYFSRFYLDKEKDMIVDLYREGGEMSYVLRTPNHGTGNLITNLATLCDLPLSYDEQGLKVIRGTVPCYLDGDNRKVYIFRLRDTKVANIYPDGTIEQKASVPAISKTLMSQTKDYRLDFKKTVVKTYILNDYKFHTDLHTHMNANLRPDLLIALGIHHQIRYPLYYIKKLGLQLTEAQERALTAQREAVEAQFADSPLKGKYKIRKIDDNTFINFADLILHNIDHAAYNIPRIRNSLAILKDGQAVFTNLEKVYLYRYVFTKGTPSEDKIELMNIDQIPDRDIVRALHRMEDDRQDPVYMHNTLFQDKLLWVARSYADRGIEYVEISDTTLVKPEASVEMLRQVHEVMPKIQAETGVTMRFLAAIRRIPLTILKDQVDPLDYVRENLQVLKAVSVDPYVAGSDIVGEEINDIRELSPLIREIVKIAADDPSFVVRIHAGENDSLRDNVKSSIACVTEALAPGQQMPHMRIGHGLYTANLKSAKGKELIQEMKDRGVVLEFQITSNVRLNNLSSLRSHPLKQYLRSGVYCVQGTDGGALYGTDSIDEQLSLEKMLDLSTDDLLAMRRAEDTVIKASLEGFAAKQIAFDALLSGRSLVDVLSERVAKETSQSKSFKMSTRKMDSASALKGRIREMPTDKVPVVLIGGSFNNDRHVTQLREGAKFLIRDLIHRADPSKVFFVIGHKITAYEKYLIDHNHGKFEIFAIIPSMISVAERNRLLAAGVSVRISIEPSGMGLYKSFAYEIFKRRTSLLVAFDGNAAGSNVVQEARNGKQRCRIFVSEHSRTLKTKALSLEGYVTLFSTASIADSILAAMDETYEAWDPSWIRVEK